MVNYLKIEIEDDTIRRIRSYIKREGRLTKGQRNAINNYWRKYGIEFSHSTLNLDSLFKRNAPKILDIGSGMGDTTTTMAFENPENDYLAIEVHRPGIGSLLRQIEINKLSNIRVIDHDVVDVLQFQLPDNCLDSVYIFFPDPWPKKKHRKRRLINHNFLENLKIKLKRNARMFLATDWQDYAEHILETFETSPGIINLAGKAHFSPRPVWRPVTRFEKRGYKLDHGVWDFIFAYSRQD